MNIDNGDRLTADFYKLPVTNIYATEISDARPFGNLAQIPSGAAYQHGQLVRDGDVYYHDNGAVLRDSGGTWYYASGIPMRDATTTFWPASITMRSGTTARYPNNAILKSGTTISYQNGNSFSIGTIAQYSDGTNLKISNGNLFYEGGATYYASNAFSYPAGATMINSSGDPFYSFGSPATLPFENFDIVVAATAYTGINVDKIARYAMAVTSSNAVHVLGGNVDFSEPPPPNPTNLQVQEQGLDYVIFNFASGGGSTQDLVYVFSLGSTPPYTPDGGTVASGSTFTIEGLAPGQQVAVRLFARNSEGEFSPGITAVGHSLLEGDFNADDSVDDFDLAQWEDDYGQNADSDADNDGDSDGLDFLAWQRNYGMMFPPPVSEPNAAVFAGSEDGVAGSPSVSAATASPDASAFGSLRARLVDLAFADGTDKTDGTYAQLSEDPIVPQALRTRAAARPDAPPPAADFGDIAASRPHDDDASAINASLDEELFATL